jgi:uncharacterized protein (TIGR03437 family)
MVNSMPVRAAALLASVFAISAAAQTYTIKTFAGGGLPRNVAGPSASLSAISGLAVDPAGNMYLALGDYHIVLRLDANTAVLTGVAGTGTAGFGGDNGPATSALLNNPTAVAVDGAGNLYIADAGNSRIRMVSAAGVITTFAGSGTPGFTPDPTPATSAQFNGLADLAIAPSGDLYVADFYNQAVRKISGGVVTTVAGNGTYGYGGDNGPAASALLAGPAGIALDAAGDLYIADTYNNRVRMVQNGIIATVAGSGAAGYSGDKAAATSAMLCLPTGVAVDSTGKLLYIADFGNYRIRMVSAAIVSTVAGTGTAAYTGDQVTATSAPLASPQRVSAGAAGAFYIGDGTRLRKVAGGIVSTIAGGGTPTGENGPAGGAQLLSPQGLSTDAAGNVYIADAGTARVLKVSGGTLSRVAGGGSAPGDNVPATSARLTAPSGVAVDSSGVLYIADTPAARVRKVSGGAISTAAGGGATLGDNGPATSAELLEPQAVAVDSGGNLYIADANRVRLVSGGTISTVAGNGAAGYQGDGGVATAAMVSGPSGVAVGPSGNLLIADSGNNRIRQVAAGLIATVAGNGTYGFTGANGSPTNATLGAPASVAADAAGNLYVADAYRVLRIAGGKISPIAGLNAPQGLAVDSAGNVYVSVPSSHRVYVLAPAGAACAATISPAPQTAAAAGGTVTVGLQTGAACSWTVESLPAWASVSGSPFGTGPGTATLSVAANHDAPRTATIVVAGQNVTLAQAGSATIAGQVTLPVGGGLAGVSLTLTGSQNASTTADSGGNFSFSNLDSTGGYTVTPSLAGYVFVPASQTFANMTANPAANFVAWPLPAIAAMGPAFPSALLTTPTTFAPGEIVTLYGANLCSTAASAVPTLPDRLAACFVQVDGVNIRIYYASPAQINAVLPQTLTAGSHQVVARYTDTSYKQLATQSQPLGFTVVPIAMAFVERAAGAQTLLAAQYADGGFVDPARPLHASDYVTLYLTGVGRTAQVFADGAAPKTTSPALQTVQVLVQGLAAQVVYAGVQPQYPGLDQIDLQLPKYTLATGQSAVTVQISAPATGQTLSYSLPAN